LIELKRFISESKNKDKINEEDIDQKYNNCINDNSDTYNGNNDNNNPILSDENNKNNPEKNSKLSELQKLTIRMSLQLNLKPKLKFDINEIDCDYLRTALHYACKCNQYDVVLYLMDQNCDLNLKDIHGRSALHFAAAYGIYTYLYTYMHVFMYICIYYLHVYVFFMYAFMYIYYIYM
jgi:ankyrin repeat protein